MNLPFLPYHLPDIGEDDIASVVDTLRSGWITTGPKAKRFEEEFARYVGAKYAIAVNSCTAAMHLALDAIGLKEDDEVIVPAMTFAATAEVVRYFRAKPVLADCDPVSLNIDLSHAERLVTGRTRAIMPVHFAGLPCDMDPLMKMASRHGLKVITDAAHALPSRYRGKMIGFLGDLTCFSFYATKTVTTAEGGMITTENGEWAERMRIMSLHGISKDAWKRYTSEGSWYYEIVQPGFKYNMPDLAAALGVTQLAKCDSFLKARESIAARYNRAFGAIPELETPPVPEWAGHSWHLYVLKLNTGRLTIGRDEFIEKLKQENIGTSVHFIPLHLHPYYRETYGYTPASLPVATAAYRRILSLPIYSRMTDADVDRVIDAVTRIVIDARK
jgi:perosamine synthetase